MENLDKQFNSFTKYKQGWMNGEGLAFSANELLWLNEKFDANYGKDLLPPAVFPTLEGGVQFEWTKPNHDVSLKVNLNDRTGYLHYSTITREVVEFNYNLDQSSEWELLNVFLSSNFTK